MFTTVLTSVRAVISAYGGGGMRGEVAVQSYERPSPPTSFHRHLLSARTASQIPCSLDQDSVKISKWSRPLLTGSGSQSEFDVTYSKQTTEKFLTGARTHISQSRFRPIYLLASPPLQPSRQREVVVLWIVSISLIELPSLAHCISQTEL
jgi:hypothetical protein